MKKLRFHHLKPTPGSTKQKLRKVEVNQVKEEKLLVVELRAQVQEKPSQHILREVKYLYIGVFLK